MDVLCFINVASVLGHEIVHITSNPLSIYSNCAGVFLRNFAEMQTLDLQLYQKKFVPRRFSSKYIRIFSSSSTRSEVSSLLNKIATLFKRWCTIDFLAQNILSKIVNFWNMLQKVYVVKSIYSRVAVCTLQACNFTKSNSIGYSLLN